MNAGNFIGHYSIESNLGKGTMGEVVLAEDTRTRTKVALKVMLPVEEEQYLEDFHRRFVNEAQFVKDLNHPSLVKVIDLGKAYDSRKNAEVVYIAHEFIPGGNLQLSAQALFKQNCLPPLDETLELVAQIADGLHYAFAHKKLIHRDLKPANILLKAQRNPQGLPVLQAVIADFGIAKSLDTETFTLAGSVLGSPAYSSPEQCLHFIEETKIDGRSDIYSLGIILYELVTGRRPFNFTKGMQDAISFYKRGRHELPSPIAFVPKLPRSIQAIINQALAINPARRYQTAKEMSETVRWVKNSLTLEEITHFSEPRYQTRSLLPVVVARYETLALPIPIIEKPIKQSVVTSAAEAHSSVTQITTPLSPHHPPSVVVSETANSAPKEKTGTNPVNISKRALQGVGAGSAIVALVLCLVLMAILGYSFLGESSIWGVSTRIAASNNKPSPTFTATPTQSLTYTPTPTITPSPTPPISTPTLAPTPTQVVITGTILSQDPVYIFTGPGGNYPLLTGRSLVQYDVVIVIGISSNASWVKIALDGVNEAWILRNAVEIHNTSLSVPTVVVTVTPVVLVTVPTVIPTAIPGDNNPTNTAIPTSTLGIATPIPMTPAPPKPGITTKPTTTNCPDNTC